METPEKKENLSTRKMLEKIYDEVVGDDEFKRKGLIERVKELENRRWKDIVASSGIGGIIAWGFLYVAYKLGLLPLVIKGLALLS